MKEFRLKYNREDFWRNYWNKAGVDLDRFLELDMYPIDVVLKYARKQDRMLECGCGAGRLVRHLQGEGYNIEGIEHNTAIVNKLKESDKTLRISENDILDLHFNDKSFDLVLCFGVIGGLADRISKGVSELMRVTKPEGLIVVSVALDNLARGVQKLFNVFSRQKLNFYTWVNSLSGWQNYFESQGLEVIEAREIVGKYNIYYGASFLRSRDKTDLRLARIKDSAYKLNFLGSICWRIHKNILKKQLAAGVTFVLRNNKIGK